MRSFEALTVLNEHIERDLLSTSYIMQVVERAIHVLFKTQANVNVLKYYLQREFRRVLENRVPFSEYLLSRDFRGVSIGATR